ncbi:MAG: hypothetical protein WBX03_11205 [Terriglobales bacterium]
MRGPAPVRIRSSPKQATPGTTGSLGWLPISVLPLAAIACRSLMPPWVFMWILSFAIYVSLKWLVEGAITN